jgi:hypothetical protein
MWPITGTGHDVLNTHQLNERKTRSCLFYFSFLKDMKIQTLMASSNDQCLYIRIYVVCCVLVLRDEQTWLWRPSCGSHVVCMNINTAPIHRCWKPIVTSGGCSHNYLIKRRQPRALTMASTPTDFPSLEAKSGTHRSLEINLLSNIGRYKQTFIRKTQSELFMRCLDTNEALGSSHTPTCRSPQQGLKGFQPQNTINIELV